MWLVAVVVPLDIGLLAHGCKPPGCRDLDEDGYGEECLAGPDCDDTNPERNVDCERVPAPNCELRRAQPGCPCQDEESAICYRGPAGTRGVGICRSGRVRCVSGHFGLCDGERVPERFETCDGEDDDCDGRIDEGVASPCGGCDPRCIGGIWGGPDAPFEAEPPLAVTDRGTLTLSTVPLESTTLWVPNTADGTLSRIDAVQARETARYFTADPFDVPAEPTRIAVDWNGDAWVANRAFGGQGSVTKVAGSLERCIDRDADGRIATSRGPDDVLPFGTDECVLLHASVGRRAGPGEDGSVPRALAIDGDTGLDGTSGGDVWVGLHGERAVVEIDGTSGRELRRVELGELAPYSATFDSRGVLWIASQDGLLARLDPAFDPPDLARIELEADCFETYALALDSRDRPYLTGFGCDRVWRYTPELGLFDSLVVPASPRGAAIVGSSLWLAHTGGTASEVDLETFGLRRTIDLDLGPGMLAPRGTVGVGAGPAGSVWFVSEVGGPSGGGLASRLDVVSGAVDSHLEVGRAPHVQGDFTGSQRGGVRASEGSARHVFFGCSLSPTEWRRIHVRAARVGPGEIRVAVRWAPTLSELDGVPFTILGVLPTDASPLALDVEIGGVLEVEVTLRAGSRRSAPELESLGVEWDCGILD